MNKRHRVSFLDMYGTGGISQRIAAWVGAGMIAHLITNTIALGYALPSQDWAEIFKYFAALSTAVKVYFGGTILIVLVITIRMAKGLIQDTVKFPVLEKLFSLLEYAKV